MTLQLENSTVLLTGASSGMGRVMSFEIASHAKTLILVARRAELLDQLAEELILKNKMLQVHVLQCDLTDLEAVKKMVDNIKQNMPPIDIVMNNAGVGNNSFFTDTSFDSLERMTRLNVLTPTLLARSFIPGMIERGHGGILNMSSLLGKIILPGHAAYVGTKHYITGLTETLRAEVAGSGVVVSGAYPGPVQSDFWEVENGDIFTPPPFLYRPVEKTAREVVNGFRAGKASIIPGLRIKFFLSFIALSPNPVVRMVNATIAYMMRKKWNKIKG